MLDTKRQIIGAAIGASAWFLLGLIILLGSV